MREASSYSSAREKLAWAPRETANFYWKIANYIRPLVMSLGQREKRSRERSCRKFFINLAYEDPLAVLQALSVLDCHLKQIKAES